MSYVLPIKFDKGPGEPIVLLHGLGNNYESWTYVLENIDETKNRVVAIDLLGFGSAPKPADSEYSAKDHADAIIETLDKHNITQTVLAGHSMGCLVAIEVARQRPDLVRKLVLLGPPLFKRVPGKLSKVNFLKVEDVYSQLFRIIRKEKDMTLAAANGVVKFLPLIKGMEINEDTWPAFKRSLKNTIMQTASYKTLKRLKTQTLLLYGVLDVFVIKNNLKSVARRNKKYIHADSAFGPHEITPIHGKKIAELLQSQ